MTACNDGAGEDHLRQRELIYFYENSSDTDRIIKEYKNIKNKKARTATACPVRKRSSELSHEIENDDDLASLSGYNGNNGARLALADPNKAPLATFTINQKLLVVEAWKHIYIYIKNVSFIVNVPDLVSNTVLSRFLLLMVVVFYYLFRLV